MAQNKIFGVKIPSTAELLAFLIPSLQKIGPTHVSSQPTPIIFASNQSSFHPLSIYVAERAKAAVVADENDGDGHLGGRFWVFLV